MNVPKGNVVMIDNWSQTTPTVCGTFPEVVASKSSVRKEFTPDSVVVVKRPAGLCVRHLALPLKFFVRAQIADAKDVVVKGVVLNGAITTYIVESEVYVFDEDGTTSRSPFVFLEERRFTEFQSLYQILKRQYPSAIIPHLPSISGNVDKSDSLVLRRRRQLALWLQYVLLHGGLQKSQATSAFIAGNGYTKFNLRALRPDSDDDETEDSTATLFVGAIRAGAGGAADGVGRSSKLSEQHIALMREVAQRDLITMNRCVVVACDLTPRRLRD